MVALRNTACRGCLSFERGAGLSTTAPSGAPIALASALRKLELGARHVDNAEAEANPATAHMFIVSPLSGRGMDNLFATHPSTANRVAALEEQAGRGLVAA